MKFSANAVAALPTTNNAFKVSYMVFEKKIEVIEIDEGDNEDNRNTDEKSATNKRTTDDEAMESKRSKRNIKSEHEVIDLTSEKKVSAKSTSMVSSTNTNNVKTEEKKTVKKVKIEEKEDETEVVVSKVESNNPEEMASLSVVVGFKYLRVFAMYAVDTGKSKSKLTNYVTKTTEDHTWGLFVSMRKGLPTMTMHGNVPKFFFDNPKVFDELLKRHNATSASGARLGVGANTMHNLAKIDGSLFLPQGTGVKDAQVVVIGGNSQTVSSEILELVDAGIDKSILAKVSKLQFYDDDFVIIVLPEGGSRTADLFLYYPKGNCMRENGKTGKVASQLMALFPAPPSR